uniref:Sucraseisomaltase, intestinallike [Zonotrichia albicollis] n=1 Tax=Lepeophtheirus salmonis TaxID=72036 RepID=A0A0K2TAW4_LEPSM
MGYYYFISLVFLSSYARLGASDYPVDCIPDSYKHGNQIREICGLRNCIYSPNAPSGPICTFPQNYGYTIKSKVLNHNGWTLILQRNSSLKSLFGNDSNTLIAQFEFVSSYGIRIQLKDYDSKRFEVPISINPPKKSKDTARLFDLQFFESPVFSFQITRKSTKEIVLSTKNLSGLIFSDQFIQVPLSVSSKGHIYGLGENEQSSLLHDMNWQSWNGWARDSTPNGMGNMYGVFPLITVVEPQGQGSTLVILNSNGQEWTMAPQNKFIYKTIGGIIDMFLFMGPSPEESLQQFSGAFGRYYIPPYWSLGHHLCRFGYTNTESIKAAYDRTIAFKIPLDAQWADIDYMYQFLDFTFDPVNFKGLPDFVDYLHEEGKHFVPIMDPAIDFESKESDGTYKAYALGESMDVWVKRSNGLPMVGKVWPFGKVHFPDFFKENTSIWWEKCVKDFHQKIKIDGLWIDMNEPSNFVDGDIEEGCPKNQLNEPPYIPRNLQGLKLASKTICPDHTHSLNGELIPHYNLHSLYGLSEARSTIRAVRKVTKTRGFVLSRSTYLSSGRYSAKWLGDNTSLWKHLRESIIGIIQFNMFGIPHIGADICGFNGNTTPELCTRWYQVGAFYPFSRNHNTISAIEQDPGVFGHKFAYIIRLALKYRYNLLPYLYTLFYNHNTQGSTVVRAMWNVFPKDNTSRNIDQQFMWGNGLLIAPVVNEGATQKDVYLPKGSRWYDISYYLQQGLITEVPQKFIGKYIQIYAPLSIVPLFIRGGFIFPLQKDDMDTTKSRLNDFMLEVVLDEKLHAKGELFYDDGISEGTVEIQSYFLAKYTFSSNGTLASMILSNGYKGMSRLKMSLIGISGLKCKTINYIVLNNSTVIGSYVFKDGRLVIHDLNLSMDKEFTITLKEG